MEEGIRNRLKLSAVRERAMEASAPDERLLQFSSDYSGNNTGTSANMFWTDDVILQRGLVTPD